jgi:hypothetical protein
VVVSPPDEDGEAHIGDHGRSASASSSGEVVDKDAATRLASLRMYTALHQTLQGQHSSPMNYTFTNAFCAYRATLANPQWAYSAMSADGRWRGVTYRAIALEIECAVLRHAISV